MHHPEIGRLVDDLGFGDRLLLVVQAFNYLLDGLLIFLGLDCQVLLKLLLQFFDQVGMLDVDVFWLLFEHGRGAFLEECHVGCNDIFLLEHDFVLDVLAHRKTSQGFLGIEYLLLDERLVNF